MAHTEPQMMPDNQRAKPALGARVLPPLAATLALAAVLLVLSESGVLALLYDRNALQAWIRARGAWAWLAFLALLAVRPLTLFPSMFLAPFAAGLFGPFLGTVLKVLGETIGATGAFLLARYGFRGMASGLLRRALPPLARSMDQGRFARLGHAVAHRGFLAVLALRVNLLLPFDGVNYGLGLTRVSLGAYVAGTLLGIVPGTFAYVALSDTMLAGDWRAGLWIFGGIVAMVLLSLPLLRAALGAAAPAESSHLREQRHRPP